MSDGTPGDDWEDPIEERWWVPHLDFADLIIYTAVAYILVSALMLYGLNYTNPEKREEAVFSYMVSHPEHNIIQVFDNPFDKTTTACGKSITSPLVHCIKYQWDRTKNDTHTIRGPLKVYY